MFKRNDFVPKSVPQVRFQSGLVPALVFGALLATQAGCSPTEVGSNSKSAPVTVQREFEAKAVITQDPAQALDVTWVIDNSPSMETEAEHVRRNFHRFVTSLQENADLKLALVSRAGPMNVHQNLPVTAESFMQVDHYIWSTDGLEAAAIAFCPPAPVAGSACEQAYINARTPAHAKIAGTLNSFVRPQSKKIFVFVTDDVGRMSSESFLASFAETFPGQQPVVYSFASLGKSVSPCASSKGTQYIKLAEATGGHVSNICEADWTSGFMRLSAEIAKWTSVPVQVPIDLNTAGVILSVEINGVVIPPSEYTLTPQGLIFSPEIAKMSAEATIKITYQIEVK